MLSFLLSYVFSYLKNILIDIFIPTVENENSRDQTIGLPKNIKSKQETFANKKYELGDYS